MPLDLKNVTLHGILIDATPQARFIDLDASVGITSNAAKLLTPSTYLQTLGLSLDKRILNLLTLVRGRLKPSESDTSFNVSLCLSKGPIIEEQLIDFIVHVSVKPETKASIIITTTHDIEERSTLP